MFLVAAVFCSNTKLSAICEMKDLSSINSLLTFTLSKADACDCNVFWPNTTTPLPGNVAIGLTFPVYRLTGKLLYLWKAVTSGVDIKLSPGKRSWKTLLSS